MKGVLILEFLVVRDEIEKAVKEQKIDRKRFFEVSKQSYGQIIKKIETAFVSRGGGIHWANMGYYRPELKCVFKVLDDWDSWYKRLPNVVPAPDAPVYALFEDNGGVDKITRTEKYWLYEACLPELLLVISETIWGDFYIVSKKYDWLISINHHNCISYVGESLNMEG